jgi:DNA-binding beta-propeller fold protein YncE/mono/diheme cytochrome c family protein
MRAYQPRDRQSRTRRHPKTMRKSATMTTAFLLLLSTAGLAAGCGGGHAGRAPAEAPKASAATSVASCRHGSIATPLGQPRTGSTIALAKLGTRNVALIADEDAHAIDAFDLETQKELPPTPLDGAPSQIMVTARGSILVLLRDKSRVQVLEAERADGPLAARCAFDTAPEPVGLAASPDDRTLFVSSGWGRALAAFDDEKLTPKYEVRLAREPRAVVISDDGATAFVSHAVGSTISAVDLRKPSHDVRVVRVAGQDGNFGFARAQKKQLALMVARGQLAPEQKAAMDKQFAAQERSGCQGFALAKSIAPGGRILAPQVFVDPGSPEVRPEGYGNAGVATETPAVAVLDEGTAEPFEASLLVQREIGWRGEKSARDHREECLLPRAAATDPRTRTLLVACFGIDNVIAYDAASASPAASERRRWSVGPGPSGIAVDPDKPRAIVWSQFDRSVSVLPLTGPDVVDERLQSPARAASIALAPAAIKLPADVALGRLAFHSGGDARISKDGRACASCHPDGRDDAITWATPDGPRRSILLAGRVASEKAFSWNGSSKTLREHLVKTFDRLDGSGLRGLELDGLVAYVSTMRPPVDAPAPGPGALDPKVKRGAELFASKETECATCHSGPAFSDGANHDVQSKAQGDRGASFRTPSLHLIGSAGPFFHDGRYATLRDVLRDADGKMGRTKQLSANDIEALEAYLRTL